MDAPIDPSLLPFTSAEYKWISNEVLSVLLVFISQEDVADLIPLVEKEDGEKEWLLGPIGNDKRVCTRSFTGEVKFIMCEVV